MRSIYVARRFHIDFKTCSLHFTKPFQSVTFDIACLIFINKWIAHWNLFQWRYRTNSECYQVKFEIEAGWIKTHIEKIWNRKIFICKLHEVNFWRANATERQSYGMNFVFCSNKDKFRPAPLQSRLFGVYKSFAWFMVHYIRNQLISYSINIE